MVTMIFRSMMKTAVGVAMAMTLSATMSAQQAERTGAPVKGTWGAEAGIGIFDDASLIRFVSPTWALMIGGSLSTTNSTGTGSAQVSGRTTATLQAGLRKYHRAGLGFRPITGFGATFGRFSSVTQYGGVYGEAGATYLFNPHVSVGALARAGLSRDGDQNTFSLVAPRVTVSIFF